MICFSGKNIIPRFTFLVTVCISRYLAVTVPFKLLLEAVFFIIKLYSQLSFSDQIDKKPKPFLTSRLSYTVIIFVVFFLRPWNPDTTSTAHRYTPLNTYYNVQIMLHRTHKHTNTHMVIISISQLNTEVELLENFNTILWEL